MLFIKICCNFAGETPPPGAYDPKFDIKIKGLVIEKADRFLETKSNAECNVSIASGRSNTTTSTSLFRAVRLIKFCCRLNSNSETKLYL